MKIGLLVLLCAVVAAACLLLRAVLRGRNKRLLLAHAHGIGSSSSEEFGISVLCSGVDTPERIDALSSTEYTRFEVIVVLDAAAFPEEFALLTARYRMIRVEWHDSQELRATGIRSLWRSRRRCCRRVVLVDRPQGPVFMREDAAADWNAAIVVAAYDYLLPLRGQVALLPDAVTRLVAELGEHPVGTLTVIRSRVGVPVSLFARDVVTDAGGFGSPSLRRALRRNCMDLWEPLACRADRTDAEKRCRRWTLVLSLSVVVAFVLLGWAAAAGTWTVAAVMATVAVALAVALRVRQAMTRMAGRTE